MKNIRLCWIAASLFCHFFMVFFLLFCFCQNFFISPKVRIRFPKSIRYLLTVHHSSQTSSSFAEPDCILLLTRIQEFMLKLVFQYSCDCQGYKTGQKVCFDMFLSPDIYGSGFQFAFGYFEGFFNPP